ncbi:hypothetical protein GCU60_10845 [Blastococcus saxobsidens]|uniref:Uncharacterized protein n=1 Tax=Blastococcus saxobsidens TaxID=138336 RepID=A0A6L9W2N1_9ACTN|nr:hypothetical protein [Blastococcus saxobsidens]NEK86253.1 hypothetical protein [Blastococcus saxobsidens]
METPSPEEARAALDQLSADESAVRYPPLPRWFFLAQAALVAGICLAQLLPRSDARNAMFGAAVVAVVLGGRYWFHRPQVAWVAPSARDMFPFLAALLAVAVACLVVDATTGAEWIWIAGAVVAAGIVLFTGHAYRRAHGDAA